MARTTTKTTGKNEEGGKDVNVRQFYDRLPEPERLRALKVSESSAGSHRITAIASGLSTATDFGKWTIPLIGTFFLILILAGPTLLAILKLGQQLNYIYIMIFIVLGIWLWRRWEQ